MNRVAGTGVAPPLVRGTDGERGQQQSSSGISLTAAWQAWLRQATSAGGTGCRRRRAGCVIGGALGWAAWEGLVCCPAPPAVAAVTARMRPSSASSAAAAAALLAGVVDVYGCSCKYTIAKPAGTRWSATSGASKQASATTVEECEQACCADSDPLGCLAFTCALHAFLASRLDSPFGPLDSTHTSLASMTPSLSTPWLQLQ